jgi:alkylation response protein AidB-like acyl-CoA dehydrogenase
LTASLADRVAALVPGMQELAERHDREVAFPAEDIAALRDAGALTLALPAETAAPVEPLVAVLTLVGSGNLSTGRVLEAHINARQLIARYGTSAQRRVAGDGALFGLWVTDPPRGGLRMRRTGATIRLSGAKQFCSSAGHATHAVVTAEDENGAARMLMLRLRIGERVQPLPAPLAGMRAAVTGAVDFDGCEISTDSLMGEPGDYLREPDFSAGAWRGSAVALGGLNALVDAATEQLRVAGRLELQHTQARMGHALIARQTARMWVTYAADAAETQTASPPRSRISSVGLARIAVEHACLDAIQHIQRSVGLSAFRQGSAIERICRDLQTYLRQPAPDEVLTEAAQWFTQ